MIKKKFKKNRPKDIHYKNLNFNKKIISVILIVFAIGVIGSVFPGENVTGAGITDDLLDLLRGGNIIIKAVFGEFFDTDDPLILYTRFILFIFVVTIIYSVVNLFTGNGLMSLIAGIGVAFLSTFFIPMEAIVASGILYSGTFMIFLLLGPALLIGFLVNKISNTKRGYAIKAVILFVFLIFVAGLRNLEKNGDLGSAYSTIRSVLIIVILFLAIYDIFKAFTISEKASKTKEAISSMRERVDTKIAELIGKIGKQKGGGIFKDGGGI